MSMDKFWRETRERLERIENKLDRVLAGQAQQSAEFAAAMGDADAPLTVETVTEVGAEPDAKRERTTEDDQLAVNWNSLTGDSETSSDAVPKTSTKDRASSPAKKDNTATA